jgi:hypothetical protein
MTVGITELPPEGMQLPGVALAGDPERGTKTTEGISLLFTTAGVTVQGPQPQIERLLVWSALDSATCREKVQLPDGREAAILELTSGGQSIRFLLPGDTVSPGQAAYLDQALPAWLLRYKGAGAPAAATPVAPGPEVGVTLPPPGPSAPAPAVAETAPEPAADTHAPEFAAAAAPTGALGSMERGPERTMADVGAPGGPADGAGNGNGNGATAPPAAPPTMQAPPVAAPPAPTAPSAPTLQAPPPPPPPPPAPPAPAAPAPSAPTLQAPPPPAPPSPPPAPTTAPPTGWDDPPLGLTGPEDIPPPAHVKKPRFALTRKKLREAEAASAVAATAAATTGADLVAPVEPVPPGTTETAATPTPAPPAATEATTGPAGAAGTETPPPPVKKPRFALTRKQLRAAEAAAAAAAAGDATAAPPAPSAPNGSTAPSAPPTSFAPPVAPPVDPVPLAVQPPPPRDDSDGAPALHPTPPGGDATAAGASDSSGTSGPSGTDGVVLADAGSGARRRGLIALVVVLVLVLVGAGYLITKKSPSTPTVTAPAPGAGSGATDTVLAGSINLRLADLPAGWTTTPPAQAVVRPPVASAVSQATAVNAMASCLDSSYAVVSGLFASGSLPGQTSLVQSPVYQSAAGSSFEMASRTTVLTTSGQMQALEGVFANPKFATCYQQFHQSLAAAATPGSTVAVQPVTLASPQGVTTYGFVSTYSVPGSGTEVVGDAYLFGGRVVTVIQPTTDGAAIPSSVFAPAYDAVAGRVAAAASK